MTTPLEQHEHSESDSGTDIRTVLASGPFIEAIKEITHPESREDVINAAVRYLAVHTDGYQFWKYLKEMARSHFIEPFLTRSIKERLGITEENEETKKAFLDFCNEHMGANGYYFHGFNGSCAENISKNGLRINDRLWDEKELQTMIDIGKRCGEPMMLGWYDINCKGKIFVDGYQPKGTYRYATGSPEWFAQFTGEQFNYKDDPKRKTAFHRRDHAAARKNIEDYCRLMMSKPEALIREGKAYPNITPEEKMKIVTFFEKYWMILAGPESKPKVALIKSKAVHGEAHEDFVKEHAAEIEAKLPDLKMDDIIGEYLIFTPMEQVDIKLKHDIKPEDIVILDLPEYSQIHEI